MEKLSMQLCLPVSEGSWLACLAHRTPRIAAVSASLALLAPGYLINEQNPTVYQLQTDGIQRLMKIAATVLSQAGGICKRTFETSRHLAFKRQKSKDMGKTGFLETTSN